MPSQDIFDFVVVGTGTAGATIVNRLSADGRHRVCALEAGGRDWHPFLHIPAGFMKTMTDPSVNWLYEAEPSEGTAGRTDGEILDFARGIGTTAFHLAGTCRMGPATDREAVVDNRLRVHGIEGLRVADASIMPLMTSANTNAAVLMIGEKAADMILGAPPLQPAALP